MPHHQHQQHHQLSCDSAFWLFVAGATGGQLRVPLAQACYLTGLNPQSIKNARSDSRRTAPPLPVVRVGKRLFVNAIDIFNFLGGDAAFPSAVQAEAPPALSPTVRRGAPSAEEKANAARRGLTVAQLRRAEVRP